jgi:hypothetical protein
MQDRCYNPNLRSWKNYGERGIKVCARWLDKENGFKNFVEDMGLRPRGKSLDRIDVNGDYSPENCRWADAKTQRHNQRRFTDAENVQNFEQGVPELQTVELESAAF